MDRASVVWNIWFSYKHCLSFTEEGTLNTIQNDYSLILVWWWTTTKQIYNILSLFKTRCGNCTTSTTPCNRLPDYSLHTIQNTLYCVVYSYSQNSTSVIWYLWVKANSIDCVPFVAILDPSAENPWPYVTVIFAACLHCTFNICRF